MSNEKFSLCIPYYNFLENRADNLMWRVADFLPENRELYQAKYSIEGDTEYLPRKLSVNAFYAKPFKPSIYSWARNDEAKVRSSDTCEVPIEIIKLKELVLENHNSDVKVRELLYKGISFYEHTLDDFLLVINEDDIYCEALVLKKKISSSTDKNIFKIDKSCQDMLRTTHKVDLITFEKNYIIDTKEINIYSGEYSFAPTRYFYKSLNLPRATRSFRLREPQDYAKAFISKYLKSKQDIVLTTNKDRQRLSQILDIALNDKAEIKYFFSETGYSLSDVQYALSTLNSDTLKLLKGEDDFFRIIEDALLRNDSLRTNLIGIAEKLWVEAATETRSSIEKSTRELELNLRKKEDEYGNLTDCIERLNLSISKIELETQEKQRELNSLNDKINEVRSKIQSELKNFQEDIVNLAAMSALSNNSISSKRFMAQDGLKLNESETDPAERLVTFAEDLKLNLDIAGLISSTVAISRIITSTIIANKNLIIDANSDNIADAISALLDSCHSHKIFVTDSNINIESLIEHINSLTTKVVLIYGLLDTFNERFFVTLSHLCRSKFIIFACEDIDTFEALPLHWWKYATLLSVGEFTTMRAYEEYESYVANEKLFTYEKASNIDINDIKRKIAKNVKNNNLSHTQALALTQLLTICKDKFGDFDLVKGYLLKQDAQSSELDEV